MIGVIQAHSKLNARYYLLLRISYTQQARPQCEPSENNGIWPRDALAESVENMLSVRVA